MCMCVRACISFSRRPFGAEWEYFVKLLFQFDERAKIPTVGFLLRKMFLEADITFTKVSVFFCLHNNYA